MSLSRKWLHRLDKAEPDSGEILDPVLSLERRQVFEYWKLDAASFAGTVIKGNLVGRVVERGA
jgi:hypothetical protein